MWISVWEVTFPKGDQSSVLCVLKQVTSSPSALNSSSGERVDVSDGWDFPRHPSVPTSRGCKSVAQKWKGQGRSRTSRVPNELILLPFHFQVYSGSRNEGGSYLTIDPLPNLRQQ